MSSLYHIDVFMPEQYVKQSIEHQKNLLQKKVVKFSKHMKDHFASPDHKHDIDKAKLLKCIGNVANNPITPFEVEVENGKVIKIVVRTSYDSIKDVSIAILFKTFDGIPFVKTAWLNNKSDAHYTLDTSKYVQGEN